ASTGRVDSRAVRRAPSSAETSTSTTTWFTKSCRVDTVKIAPPPSETTPSDCSASATCSASISRNFGSPKPANTSPQEVPSASSMSSSESTRPTFKARDKRRPMVDLPAPGGPTNTTRGRVSAVGCGGILVRVMINCPGRKPNVLRRIPGKQQYCAWSQQGCRRQIYPARHAQAPKPPWTRQPRRQRGQRRHQSAGGCRLQLYRLPYPRSSAHVAPWK